MNVTGSSLVLEKENNTVSPETGITVDKMEQVAKVHGEVQDHEGNTVEKPSGEAIAIGSDIGQTFVSSQTAVSNVALGEEGKETPNEMVFTVVAVDGNIGGLIQSSFNSGGLPKEVQLSIVPAVSESSTSTINTTDVQNAGLFNQLALLASTMQAPSSPRHQQGETQQLTEQLKDPLPNSGMKSSPFDLTSRKAVKENARSLNKSEENYSPDGKPAKKPRVSCPICDQDFSDLPSMRRHRLIHSNVKPYQCEFCDKAFRRKDNLREHRNIHTQENVYTCTRCGKTFPRKYTHKVHMAKFCAKEKTNSESCARNEEEATWMQSEDDKNAKGGCATSKISSKSSSNTKCSDPCKICYKTFRDTSTLKRHLLTHSDERPFKCEECNKSFRRKDHLQEHIIVHNEVRPFACHQCGKSFSRKNGLKTHMIRTSHLTVRDAQLETVTLTQLAVEGFKDAKVSDNDELTPGETSSEFQLVLTTNEAFPKHADGENESHVVNTIDPKKVSPQTDLGIKDGGVTSVNVDFSSSEISVNLNSENSGIAVSNADEMKEIETTVVLSEKNKETALANEKDGGVGPKSDSSNFVEFNTSSFSGSDNSAMNSERDVPRSSSESEKYPKIQKNIGGALQCPDCRGVFYGKHALWEHFQEHLSDELFACEHCLTTFTESELVKEHQKECTDVVGDDIECNRMVSVGNNSPGKSREVVAAGSSPPEEMLDALTGDISSDRGETGEEGSSQGLNEDVVKTLGEKQLRICTICNKQFRDSTALRRHSLVHSGERPHACEQCGKRFRRRDHLKSHVTAYHSGTTMLHCKNCNMEFTTRYCLATHAKLCKKSGVRPQATTSDATKLADLAESKCCPVCNKTFKDPSTQRRHLRIHSEERPFQCDVCPKSFRRKDNLKEHMLCHSDQKPFACEDCGKALSRRSSLTNHRSICPMKRMDDNSIPETHPIPENHSIPESHSISESDPIPENHSLPESNPIPETLDMCASGVNQQLTSSDMNDTGGDAMEDIQELDNDDEQGGDKGFSCNRCGKVFRAKWTLKYHQRVHTGEKPYTCLTCDRQFRQPSHLKIHQRTHSGERPYLCEVCGRAFIDSSTMRRHARLHKDNADPDEVMDESVSTDETDVHPTEDEVSMQGECIEMAVSSISANETSAQPISTAVVPAMNQSEPANLVQVVRGLVGDEPSQTDEMTLSAKIQTLSDVNWQQNAQENERQMTYYIVPANKESSEKQCQDTFENISF